MNQVISDIEKLFSDVWIVTRYLMGEKTLKQQIETKQVSPSTVWTMKMTLAGVSFGIVSGFWMGSRRRGLQFLAENSHRLPRTKGGWFYYHRFKNYAMIRGGTHSAVRYAGKCGGLSLLFFGSEQLAEYFVGENSFNAVAAGLSTSLLHSIHQSMSMQLTRRAMLLGVSCGVGIGCLTELYKCLQNGKSIKEPRLPDFNWSSFINGSRWI